MVGGSRRHPPTVPDHTSRNVAIVDSTAARRAASPRTGRPSAACSAAYGVPVPPPAPMPSSSRPPLTSCSVAAITASVPASRLATLSTSGPMASCGTAAASGAEHGPALEDVRGTVGRPGEVVVEPHAVEARLLGEHGGVAEVLPPPAERVEQQVDEHAADRTGPSLLLTSGRATSRTCRRGTRTSGRPSRARWT